MSSYAPLLPRPQAKKPPTAPPSLPTHGESARQPSTLPAQGIPLRKLVLRTMEREGMSINAVIAEINRLEEIVKLGRDPRSLIETRKDFNRNLTDDIEQL